MAAEHPQRTKLRYQSNSTFVLKPKSAGGVQPRSAHQKGPSATRMVASEEVSNTALTAATAMPVSSTINTPSARTSYMALEMSETPATMMGVSSMGPMGYPTSGSPITTFGSMHPGLYSDVRCEETFEAEFGSDGRRPRWRGAMRSRSRRAAGSSSRMLPPDRDFDADDESERRGDDRRTRRRRQSRRGRRSSFDEDEDFDDGAGGRLVCTCGASSSGGAASAAAAPSQKAEDFEDLFVLKKTGERKKKKKKKPPPPPPPAGFMGMLCGLFGSKPPPPPPPQESSSESEYESEYELRRLDRQQLEHFCRQIDFKQFIKLPEPEKKEEKKPATDAKPAPPPTPLDVKVPVIFVFGGPGSGKGTQCGKIVEKYGFTHISSGDLLRAEVQSGSDRGKEMNEVMKKGELVPLDIVLQLLKEAIKKDLGKSKGFLIDGYPRNTEQGDRFEAEVCKCTNLIYFDVKDETMKARLLKRGETSGRVDDNEETISKRIKTFHNESEPVLEKYKPMVLKVSAEEDPDKVFETIVPFFDNITKPK
ncbi:uncharacterized protein [Dermacentor albipictus]|uniref:uncharacterized protein n=1 Tax=Dermacentor albipictus TaxID=60249 RepID=UPI0038FC8289